MDRETLIAEIKRRRAAGRKINIDLRADKSSDEQLAKALESDDLENGGLASEEPAATQEEAPAADVTPSPAPAAEVRSIFGRKRNQGDLRNQLSTQAEAPSKPTQPSDEEFEAQGGRARNKADGLTYEVIKRDSDEFNKPFKARVPAQSSGHPGLYWEGSEEEFLATFEQV